MSQERGKRSAVARLLLLTSVMGGLHDVAAAESDFAVGSEEVLVASASLDFTIIVPRFVYLQVGTGSAASDNGTVDKLVFTIPPGSVGDGSLIPADIGTIKARVIGNHDTIVFSSTTLGPLMNASGDTISFSEIDVAVGPDASSTVLAHPMLVDAGTMSLVLPMTDGKLTQLDAKWAFSYRNREAVPAGEYGGVNTRNGRVTYSIAMP